MRHQIVTNNPEVRKFYDNVIFVDGSHEEVLIRVRDYVHQGYRLISHPLGASIRIFFSPYRSIIIGQQGQADDLSRATIENSLSAYQKQMTNRVPDAANARDYATIDLELLRSALTEYKIVYT